jgi:hypothetical protein
VARVTAGAAALVLVLGTLNRAAGGPFFFLRATTNFAAGIASGRISNIWRDVSYSWLSQASWLVVPALVSCGCLALLLRRRRLPDAQRAIVVATQVQLPLYILLLVVMQLRGFTVLEHFYAASMLLPLTFLAFAGQLAALSPVDHGFRPYIGLVAAELVLALLPWVADVGAIQLMTWTHLTNALVLPLGIGAAGALVVLVGGPGRVAAAVWLLAAVLAQSVLLGWIRNPAAERDAARLFLQMDQVLTAIEGRDPSLRTRLWYDLEEPHGQVLDAIASAFLLCPSLVTTGFPRIDAPTMCDGKPLLPGQPIVVLSTAPQPFERAAASLAELGQRAVPMGQQRMPGPVPDLTLTFLRTASF